MLDTYRQSLQEIEDLVNSMEQELLPLLSELEKRTGIRIQIIDVIGEIMRHICEGRNVVLGFIGQIKAGKSTLLNALLFDQDGVLPAATTPKTARLTILRHTGSERPGATVHFHSREEWEQIEEKTQRQGKSFTNISGVRHRLGPEIEKLLGRKEQLDSLLQLDDYVGADGKYSILVKFVEIRHPHPMLLDLEIVDTPGLNDPVKSREEETRRFLEKADAVVFLTTGGRPFDREDLTLAMKDFVSLGISDVITVVPQVDERSETEFRELENQIIPELPKRVEQFAREMGFGSRAQELASKAFSLERVVLVSAMAHLLAQKLEKGEELSDREQFALRLMERHGWPVNSPQTLAERSCIRGLRAAIEERVIARKREILFIRPLKRIESEIDETLASTSRRLKETEEKLTSAKKNIADLQGNLEKRMAEFESVKDALQDELAKFNDDLQQREITPFHVTIPPPTFDTPLLSKRREEMAVECEITQKACESLTNQTAELKQEYIEIKRELQSRLEEALERTKEKRTLLRELQALIHRLFGQLDRALDDVSIEVSVKFRYNFWQWLIGQSWISAEIYVKRAVQEAERQVQNTLERNNKNAVIEFRKFVTSLENRLEELLSERKREIDLLVKERDMRKRDRKELQRQYESQMAIFQSLSESLERLKANIKSAIQSLSTA